MERTAAVEPYGPAIPKLVIESRQQEKLRLDAERRLKEGTAPSAGVSAVGTEALALLYRLASNPESASDALKLLHELQVHQVELDLQHAQIVANEHEVAHALARYKVFYDSAPIGYFIVGLDGQVIECNRAGARLLSHATALFPLDEARAEEYFDELVANDCVWLSGNGHCMREVAAGRFAFGWTDTDDYYVAKLQGKPVAAVYPDQGADEAGVLFIPNSLVLIKGAKHRDAGLALINWLLRPETEAMLAASATAQIPVRPGVPVPDHVRRPDQIGKVTEVDWGRVGREWDKWTGHVKAKFAGAAADSGEGSILAWIVTAVVVVAVGVVVLLRRLTATPA